MDRLEIAATLSLATDLSIGVPLEHGLQSAVIADRLSQLASLAAEEHTEAFYTALLFYVGCTGTALTGFRIFGSDEALTTYAAPVRFDIPRRQVAGMARAVAPPGRPMHRRALQLARGMPRLLRAFPEVIATNCDVAQVLIPRLGLPEGIGLLFTHANDRWDGKGSPGHVRGDAIPLPMRVAQLAQDAAFQRMLGGDEFAVAVIRSRSGAAFDPELAQLFARKATDILATGADSSAWSEAMASQAAAGRALEDDAVDQALAAMGDFADLVSPYLVGHSQGVAELAAAAGRLCNLSEPEQQALRRSALVQDLGRVAVPTRVWANAGPLSAADWESFRLHAYQSERLLSRSDFLRPLATMASLHHERLDGSGYHRGCSAAALPLSARILAAADRYRTLVEPRAHRPAHVPEAAAAKLATEAREGLLDTQTVAAVIESAGLKRPRLDRPGGLSPREQTVVGLLARGLQTKQIARVLGVSPKTADTHIQHAYRKIGVSTRAGAALYASQHGLAPSGELPMAARSRHS